MVGVLHPGAPARSAAAPGGWMERTLNGTGRSPPDRHSASKEATETLPREERGKSPTALRGARNGPSGNIL